MAACQRVCTSAIISTEAWHHSQSALATFFFLANALRKRECRFSGLRGKSSVWAATVPGVRRMTLLLLASGYLGLRIMALEAQLKSLGALTELLLHTTEWVGVHASLKVRLRTERRRKISVTASDGRKKKKTHKSGSNRFGCYCFKKPSHDTSDYTSRPAGWQQQRGNVDR